MFWLYVIALAGGGYAFIQEDFGLAYLALGGSVLAGLRPRGRSALLVEWWVFYVPLLITISLMCVMLAGASSAVGHDAFGLLLSLPFLMATEMLLFALGVAVRRLSVRYLRWRRGSAEAAKRPRAQGDTPAG